MHGKWSQNLFSMAKGAQICVPRAYPFTFRQKYSNCCSEVFKGKENALASAASVRHDQTKKMHESCIALEQDSSQ
jgi:hypothetical protein